MTIEMYEQMNILEAQRNKIQTQINNLQEIHLVCYEDYSKLIT